MSISKISLPSAPIGLKSNEHRVDTSSKGNPVTSGALDKEQEKIKAACQDFEAIFLNFMLSKMREAIPKSDLMGSDQGEKLYRGMLDEELSKQMAASGGMGLAEMLYRQFSERR